MNQQILQLLTKILIGSHPKTSIGGYVCAALLALLQGYLLYTGGDWDNSILAGISAFILVGRAARDPKPSDENPKTGSVGTTLLLIMALLAAGLFLTGCVTSQVKQQIEGRMDATDGKAFGLVDDSQLEKLAGKFGMSGAEKWLHQYQQMMHFYNSIPADANIDLWLQQKSTGRRLAWDDVELQGNMSWSSKVSPAIPNFGNRNPVRIINPDNSTQTLPSVTNDLPINVTISNKVTGVITVDE